MNSYDRAVRAIRDRRREQLDRAQLALDEALRSNDKLHASFCAYQEEMIKAARGEKNNIEKTRADYEKKLKAAGITDKTLDPPPHCAACNDTGVLGGKYCKCVIKSVIQSDSANLTLPLTDFSASKKTAPTAIKAAYAAAEKYILGDKTFFILLGNGGTGKTVLAAAIATELMKSGAPVVTVTSFDFVRRALEYHTQFKIDNYIDRFTPMLDCELLVIDDLGKEPTLNNVTNEYLYTIINERWTHKKKTVITSNLTPEEIMHRYLGPVTSRMFDKKSSYNFIVSGKNTRLSD